MSLADADPVIQEEFAADDKEQDDTGNDVSEGLVQAVGCGDLRGTPLQEHNEKTGKHHDQTCRPHAVS